MQLFRQRYGAAMVAMLLIPRLLAAELPPPAVEPVDFARQVRPIFERACVECHGAKKQRSSFRLDQRAAAHKGGDLGTAILPGNSSESPLIHYIAGQDTSLTMPPDGPPLSAEAIGILRRWIDDGAIWPDEFAGEEPKSADGLWSIQTLSRPALPDVISEWQPLIQSPVDQFIFSRLKMENMSPSPVADRRTLIRRLTYDLHGLPPTADEIQQFERDSAPNAYERLVDRLLESERYGERWARHWLDVAHYADSHGQDQDRPRPNAWPYRDYVIHAFNSDKPYGRFVAEQVAGDVLFPAESQVIAATGFLAAGPFDESSLVSIREDSIDRLIGQYLDRDDIVTTTMGAFAGLTVGCARCHDHKFDPITQEDYYALQAVFAGIDKAERRYDTDPQVAATRGKIQEQLRWLRDSQGNDLAELRSPERLDELARFEAEHAEELRRWIVLRPTDWKSTDGSELNLLDDNSLLASGMRPERDTYLLHLKSDVSTATGLRVEVMSDESLPMKGPGRQENGNLHLSEIRIKAHPAGQPERTVDVAIKSAVADFDQTDWGIQRAIDRNPATAWGIFPQVGKDHSALFEFLEPIRFDEGIELIVELDQLHGGGHLIGRLRISLTQSPGVTSLKVQPLPEEVARRIRIPPSDRTCEDVTALSRWLWEQSLQRELASLPEPSRVFCGTNQFVADGSFRPVEKPRPVHILKRGSISQPGELAVPGSVQAIRELPARFALADSEQEGLRRAALANWLIDPRNPITWRVIVNRVWHYHFGKGIVDSPNDLGRMGGKPSHPELLDWLAAEFRDDGGKLKRLHKWILMSHTYRQSAAERPDLSRRDADNRLLWRMNRRRIDAESYRDSVLAVCDRLVLKTGGAPAMQFVMTPGIHVTPNADYDHIDLDSVEARRRSIYRYIFRTRPDPLLDLLDCPDGSQAAPVRGSSVSPLQALALWNNRFVLHHAELLAQFVIAGSPDSESQLALMSERLFGRRPSAEEQQEWSTYASEHGLANLCRVLMNSSEFIFVD